MQNFILNIWNAYTLIDVVLIMFFAMLSLFYFLRLKQAKKKLKTYQFHTTMSAQTMQDYEDQIKLQECQIEDRKKYFEDAVAEITELRIKNKQLEANDAGYADRMSELKEANRVNTKTINELILNRDYWKERALHQKHSKPLKQVESEWWECINEIKGYFVEGCIYKTDNLSNDNPFPDNVFRLFINDNHLHSYLVNRKDFKPVQK